MTQAVTLAGLGSTTPTIVSPTLTSPVLGTPVSGSLVNCTDVNYTGFKNRIINGGMVIDQRNAGASVTPTSSGAYIVDRWQTLISLASKFSVQQNAGAAAPPSGFSNYLGATSLSAYSLGVSDYFALNQRIEGFNIADLGWGTASAATVTLSFQVRSSLTGTFGGTLRNSAGNRSYPFTYTVSSANTWTTINVTIAGDTTGTWATNNGTGVGIAFGLGSGSTYTSTAGSWQTGNYISATGAVSVVGTSGATFYITGVQLEKGSVATSFDQRAYSQELAMCQRYYYQLTCPQASTQQFGSAGQAIGANAANGISVIYPVTMRATATLTTSTVGNFILQPPGGGSYTVTAISYTYASIYQASLTITVTGGAFSGGQCTWMYTATLGAYLGFSAEL